MTPALLLEQLLNGLITGSIYALFAVGLALTLGVMDLVNTAHGEMYMVGAYAALAAMLSMSGQPWIYLPVAALAGFLLGVAIDLTMLRPLRHRRGVDLHMVSLILTFGISIALQNLGIYVLSARYQKAPELLSGATTVGDMVFINQHLLTFGMAVVLTALLFLFLQFTRVGYAIRATAQNSSAARLVGIDTDRIASITFGLGASLAALSGALLGPLYYVHPTMGTNIMMKGFAIVIVGGMGSIPGAIAAGFLLGISESVGGLFLSYSYKEAIGFMLLAVTLLLRPSGLWGKPVRA